jgi:ribosome biogenesis GTPase
MTGLVLRTQGGVYQVETSEGLRDAVLRGRVKQEARVGDRVVVGDRVELARSEEGAWTIETVHERHSALVRRAPGKARRAKVIAANIDQVVIVFSVAKPTPHLRMLDRFLVLCESTGLDAVIIANKVDLIGEVEARRSFGLYERIGYPVLYTSVKQGVGMEELRETLRGRISALTGPSGVGKSSLLNSIQPGLALRVSSVSEAVGKGRHTTVTAELIPLGEGSYVADTPGLRELGLWDVPEEELDRYFPEFEPYLGSCRYGNSCSHSHEPACAVRDAVDEGTVPPERYASYLKMLAGEDEE